MQAAAAGALSLAERSYPTSEVRGNGLECQAATVQKQPGGDTLNPRSGAAAERSYPASKASGSREETPRVQDQGQPGEATSCPRLGAAAGRSHPRLRLRPGPGGATRGVVAAQHRRA